MSAWRMNGDGQERVTHTGLVGDQRQVWRHVGWIGQTGRAYPLGENPAPTEPGGFSPLWLLVEDEQTPIHEERAA